MQPFYKTKMMMLVFSIIVMYLHFFPVGLVSRVLKNTRFKEYLSMVASKYNICDMEKILRNLNYVQCLNIGPIVKAWFMAPMEYSPNREGIMTAMGYIPMIYSPNGKGMVLWKIIFRSGNGLGKSSHYHCQFLKGHCKRSTLARVWGGGAGVAASQLPFPLDF